MPILESAIVGGASLVGNALNAFSTGNMNKKSRAFATQMYERQKYDNLNFWNMQNEYNSPAMQMQRFKDAGLNPNLIYGQQNTAGPLTSSDVQKPEFNAPRYGDAISGGALSAIDAMYNLEMKQAQTDNMKLQSDVIRQEAALKAAQILDVTASGRRKMFDLDFESQLRSTSVDARKEALRQLKVNTDMNIARNMREQVMMSSNLREASERISNLISQQQAISLQNANTIQERKRIIADTRRIKQQIALMAKEGVIKDLDVKLSKENIRPGDPLWYRAIAQGFNSVWNFLFEDE